MKKNSWAFKSRYGQDRILKKIEENLYSLEGVTMFTRGCFNDDPKTIEYIDLEGGPFVQLNDTITDTFGVVKDDRKIISISSIPTGKDYAYILIRVS